MPINVQLEVKILNEPELVTPGSGTPFFHVDAGDSFGAMSRMIAYALQHEALLRSSKQGMNRKVS